MLHTQIFSTNLGLATISDVILLQIGVGRRIECDQYVLVVRLDERVECYETIEGVEMFRGFLDGIPGGAERSRFSHLFRAAVDADLLDMRAVQVRVCEYHWKNRRRD